MRRLLHRILPHLDSHPLLGAVHLGVAEVGRRTLCLHHILADDYCYGSTVMQHTNTYSLPTYRARTLIEQGRSGGLQLCATDLLDRILADGRKPE
jgi:hypothetical protein